MKKLDASFAQAMQVASSPEEWKAQGIKGNYEMATMCFERAGEVKLEKWSKAALKETVARMCGLNPERSRVFLNQAAEILVSIGKADSAAKCHYEWAEHKKAEMVEVDSKLECCFLS